MTKATCVGELSGWLVASARKQPPYNKFALTDITESPPIAETTKLQLCRMLQEARIDLGLLDLVKRLEWKTLEGQLSSAIQPKEMTAQRGEFGEVLTNAILREFLGYTIPVEKLRSTIESDQSLPSTDTIAIKSTSTGLSEVCFVESKLRTSKSTGAALQGYNQLTRDYLQLLPDMVIFVLKSLFDKKEPLFYHFLHYLNDRTRTVSEIETFHIGLTWENQSWSEATLKNLEEGVSNDTPRLAVHLVRLTDLGPLVKELFRRIGVEKVNDNEND